MAYSVVADVRRRARNLPAVGEVVIVAAGAGFTNQPSNDGVEVLSDNAADTSQPVAIYGTTNGTDTVFVESVSLNGTTPVATTKNEWGEILGVEMDETAVGTVTVRGGCRILMMISKAGIKPDGPYFVFLIEPR